LLKHLLLPYRRRRWRRGRWSRRWGRRWRRRRIMKKGRTLCN